MNDGAMMRSVLPWGIAFAIVVGALGYETNWGRSIDPDPVATTVPHAAPVTVSLLPEYKIAGGTATRKETVDRVLFNPTRRAAPPAVQTAGGGPGAMQKGVYTLTGTTVVGNVATAFLREVKGGKSHTVHQGETLDGIVIADVAADHVRLNQGDEIEDLQLKIASGPKSTIQVAAPTPAQAPGARPAIPAAGGSAPHVPNGAPVPPAPPTSINPNAAQRPGGTASVSEILAERRRAARAAAAAAAANQSGVQRAQ